MSPALAGSSLPLGTLKQNQEPLEWLCLGRASLVESGAVCGWSQPLGRQGVGADPCGGGAVVVRILL